MNAAASERRYLSIVQWPEGTDRRKAGVLLSQCTSIDEHTWRMRLGGEPPITVGPILNIDAQQAAAHITKHGGDAFHFNMDEITRAGATHVVKNMRCTADGIVLERWRDEPLTIDPQHIDVIVRGGLIEQDIRQLPAPNMYGAAGGLLIAGGLGMPMVGYSMFASQMEEALNAPANEVHTNISHRLDIHYRDPRQGDMVIQFNASKYNFDVLGSQRGAADAVNMQRLVELWTHLCPDAAVDVFYTLFKAPQGLQRLRIPRMHLNDEDAEFIFYSRWAAMLYRHVIGHLPDLQ